MAAVRPVTLGAHRQPRVIKTSHRVWPSGPPSWARKPEQTGTKGRVPELKGSEVTWADRVEGKPHLRKNRISAAVQEMDVGKLPDAGLWLQRGTRVPSGRGSWVGGRQPR